ncbi:OmpA family protein [Pseudochryseolinea flava]|uniref:OmpA-like domain-containing protein n=1 Tax=Pseudochryseolinea flava TaxID=2059302 RepID=A0A364Y5S3_9BACT|nr:OmpA family protein [Pseudochryseolinea flava]RAW01187.1 hypothetical protein DQQ10_09735 [Pseudochryseolinea flava]
MKILGLLTTLFLTLSVGGQPNFDKSFAGVNTAYDELSPVISPDGRTLFVTIANHPGNIGGKKDPGDIWVSTLGVDNQWSAPVHGGTALNNGAYNAVAGFSADGTNLFLMSHYDPSGNVARTQGISVSHPAGAGWSRPENINIPYYQNKSLTPSGFILPDQSVFIFSAETYGTHGVDDLYVTLKGADQKWSAPINLGAVINTHFQELSPSLSNDGKTLYFSSNGRKGKGSFDVYSATRLDDSWTKWSEPVNVGSPVNSEGRDLYYRAYPGKKFSLYTSTINSDGYGDIKFYQDDHIQPNDTPAIAPVEPPVISSPVVEAKPSGVRVYGKVTNAKTGEVVTATLQFTAAPAVSLNTASSKDGYRLVVPAQGQYSVRIQAAGYVSALQKLDATAASSNDLELNFSLQPIEVGTSVDLSNVLFEQSKTMLLPQSYDELDMVATFLKDNPKVKIELRGHTDNRGIPAQNVKLSQARVDKVKTYLVGKGIDRKRIKGKGYGGASPVASNETVEGRQLNRRVEFVINEL